MNEQSQDHFRSSEISRFIILGNPQRRGVLSSAEKLKILIDHDREIKFIPTGSSPLETFQHLYDITPNPNQDATFIIGGDGTIRNVFEALRYEEDFRKIASILTKFVGGARDLNSNLDMRKNQYELADLILHDGLKRGSIYPIEARFHQQDIIRAYNVLGIGATALMADRINHNQIFHHRTPQMIINALLVAKSLKDKQLFDVTLNNQNNSFFEIIATKGKRFAGIIKTTSKDLDPDCRLHLIDNLNFRFLISLILGQQLESSCSIDHNQKQQLTIHNVSKITAQADGETFTIRADHNQDIDLEIGLSKIPSIVLTTLN